MMRGRRGTGLDWWMYQTLLISMSLADRPLTEENITQWALRATGDYLFREGYTYLAEQVVTRCT